MKRTFYAVAILALSLSACKGSDPLKNFVEQSVKLRPYESGQTLAAAGAVEFRHTFYTTTYRNVCDNAVCGYTQEYRCHTVERCFGEVAAIESTEAVADVHRGPGVSVPRGGPARRPPPHGPVSEPRWEHERPRPPVRRCEPVRTCGYQTIPRYCPVNCRQEPYTSSNTQTYASPVAVEVRTTAGVLPAKAVQALYLGVKPTANFITAKDNPSYRPKGTNAAFDAVAREDRTLLIMRANGYELIPNQNFMQLPANFQPGQPVVITVWARPAAGGAIVSATGTAADLPVLHSTSSN